MSSLLQNKHESERTLSINTIILEVLREAQEREKGCEYCNVNNHNYIYVSEATEPRIFFDMCGSNIRFFNEEYPGYLDTFPVNYCPMCGRKLKEG